MPSLTIRTKLKFDGNGSGVIPDWFPSRPGERWVKLPKLGPQHFNRADFHRDPRFSAYSNSDILVPLILRTLRDQGTIYQCGEDWRIILSHPTVTLDESGFLAQITLTL